MRTGRIVAAACVVAVVAATVASAALGRPQAAKPVTLTAWTYTATWKPGIEAAVAAYNRATHSNLKVNVQYIAEANGVYASKVAAGARTNTLPDLLVAYGDPWQYVGAGLFKELTKTLGAKTLAQFPPAILNNYVKYSATNQTACGANPDCTYKNVKLGQIYFAPQISGGTGFVFALKSKVAKAGITSAPTTWSAWIADMAKTKAKFGNNGGLSMPLQIPEAGLLWLFNPLGFTYLGSQGLQAAYNDKTGNAWTSPAVEKVFELYDQLTPYWQPGVLQNGQPQAFSALASGQATWYYGGTFSLAGLIAAGVKPSDLMIFPMPAPADGTLKKLRILQWGSGFIGISRDSKNPSAALSFLRFYFSPPGGEAFSKAANDQPAVRLASKTSAKNPLYPATSKAFGQGPNAFSDFTAYGPHCDAASTLTNQAAVALTGLLTNQYTASTLAAKFHDLYGNAWKACG